MTEYDEHLRNLQGRVGQSDAYAELKQKVLAAIREAYPWLAPACAS